MAAVRVRVYEFQEKDHLQGTSASGRAYDLHLQYGLVDQGSRPAVVIVVRRGARADLLPPGDYVAELFLEARKGAVEPVLDGFKLAQPVAKAG